MGIWDNLPGAEVYDRGVFLKPGTYTLRIKNAVDKNTRKSGRALILEFEVLESSNHEHMVGTSVTWFQSLKDMNVALGAVKEFCAAVYQKDLRNPAEKKEFETTIAPALSGVMERATSQNSLQNQVVKVEVTMVKTQKGTDFSRHTWMPYRAA